jgi:putative sterol carrier protein
VEARGRQTYLVSEDGTCRFHITSVGTWLVTIKNGVPTVVRDGTQAAPVDCVFTCSPDVFLRIRRPEDPLNPATAMLQRLVEVEGDPSFAWAVLSAN